MFACVVLAISLGKFTLRVKDIIYISTSLPRKVAFHYKQDF